LVLELAAAKRNFRTRQKNRKIGNSDGVVASKGNSWKKNGGGGNDGLKLVLDGLIQFVAETRVKNNEMILLNKSIFSR
jgi:hypothetical protein